MPDDVALIDVLRAMRSIGLKPTSTHPLRMERVSQHDAQSYRCAFPGCKRPGVIQWEVDGGAYCSDHAWDLRRKN